MMRTGPHDQIVRKDPDGAIFHSPDGPYRSPGYGGSLTVFVNEPLQAIGRGIEDIQPALRTDPYISRGILEKGGDHAMAKGGLAKHIVLNERLAVVTVQSAVGTEPYNALPVLQH